PPPRRLGSTSLPEMLRPPQRISPTPPPGGPPRWPPTACLCARVLSRSVPSLPLEGANGFLPLFQRPPPMPASTKVPAVLPSPPAARLCRSVTLLRVRLTGSPDRFPAEVAIPPPVPVPTNWTLTPSPRLPLPPRASLFS